MSKTTHTLLFALMIPALATLAACAHEVDDDYATPTATGTPSAAGTMQPDPAMQSDPAMPPADEGMATTADNMTFAEMDTNQDGGISLDELSPDQMLHQHFDMADADGNGMLSEAEVNQHRADMGMDTSDGY